MLIMIPIVFSWSPPSDIDMRHYYRMFNVTNVTADYFYGNLSWNYLYNYPAGCPAGTAISGLNDSTVCVSILSDITNASIIQMCSIYNETNSIPINTLNLTNGNDYYSGSQVNTSIFGKITSSDLYNGSWVNSSVNRLITTGDLYNGSAGNFSASSKGNSTYWKLDGTNRPTTDWNMNAKALKNISSINLTMDDAGVNIPILIIRPRTDYRDLGLRYGTEILSNGGLIINESTGENLVLTTVGGNINFAPTGAGLVNFYDSTGTTILGYTSTYVYTNKRLQVGAGNLDGLSSIISATGTQTNGVLPSYNILYGYSTTLTINANNTNTSVRGVDVNIIKGSATKIWFNTSNKWYGAYFSSPTNPTANNHKNGTINYTAVYIEPRKSWLTNGTAYFNWMGIESHQDIWLAENNATKLLFASNKSSSIYSDGDNLRINSTMPIKVDADLNVPANDLIVGATSCNAGLVTCDNNDAYIAGDLGVGGDINTFGHLNASELCINFSCISNWNQVNLTSSGGNTSFNQSYTDTLYYPLNNNPSSFLNSTTITNTSIVRTENVNSTINNYLVTNKYLNYTKVVSADNLTVTLVFRI